MADLVDLLIDDDRWMALDLDRLADTACGATLRHLDLEPKRFAIGLLACDDARIAELNTEFRNKSTPTNVLSWPAYPLTPPEPGLRPVLPAPDIPDAPQELGDIAISYDTCLREASESGHEIAAHVSHLLIHATLHLLGYDHISEQDAAVMEGTEVEILAPLGYPNPYRAENQQTDD